MLAFLNVWEKNIFNLPLPKKIVVFQRRIFWYFFNGCFIKCGGDIFNLQFTQWRKSRLSLEVKEFTQSKEAGADLVKSDFEIIFKKWKFDTFIQKVKAKNKFRTKWKYREKSSHNQRKQVQIWYNQISDYNLKKIKIRKSNSKQEKSNLTRNEIELT